MTDKALKNANMRRELLAKQINEYQQQIEEWRRELRHAEAFIEAWYDFSDGVERPIGNNEARADSLPTKSKRIVRPKNPPKEQVAEAAYKIILEHGKPMGRTELFVALFLAGIELHGKNPEMVLSTMLWRMKNRIARVEGAGYWPADIANKDAGYDPELRTSISESLNTPAEEITDPDSDEARELFESSD